jgi:hypothetical protein
MTKTINTPINTGLIFFSSSSCSAALPIETLPLLAMFLLNLLDLLRILRGAGYFLDIYLYLFCLFCKDYYLFNNTFTFTTRNEK